MIPTRELISRPRERFVQVAEVAGIRPSSRELVGGFGTADLMAANRFQHAIARVRHMTIVALAPAGSGLVMRMCGCFSLRAELFVTLRASSIVRAVSGELIVRLAAVQ